MHERFQPLKILGRLDARAPPMTEVLELSVRFNTSRHIDYAEQSQCVL